MFRWHRGLFVLLLIPALLAGCTARPRTPGAQDPGRAQTLPPRNAATPDPDALLDQALRRAGAEANGVETLVIGNTVLVAMDNARMPFAGRPEGQDTAPQPGPMGTAGLPGANVPNEPDLPDVPDRTAVPGAPGAAGTPGALGAPGAGTAADNPRMTDPGAPGAGAAAPGRPEMGRQADPTPKGANVDRPDPQAVARIITGTLPWVREVRVATDTATADRLRRIASDVQRGRPMSAFLDEVAQLSENMAPVAAAPQRPDGQPAPVPAPGAPGAPDAQRAPAAPAPGGAAGTPAPGAQGPAGLPAVPPPGGTDEAGR